MKRQTSFDVCLFSFVKEEMELKKGFFSLGLMCSILLSHFSFAVSFKDVSDSHWAYSYIVQMQIEKVINGYPDGSFKPEDTVKTGEFIKMASMILWPNFHYEMPTDGSHWAMPYVNSLNHIALKSKEYDAQRLERKITRGEATIILSKVFLQERIFQNRPYKIEEGDSYLQRYTDISSITDSNLRTALNICTQYGLMNGFEDNSFRANEFLTRAQAAKLMVVLEHN